MNLPKEWTPLNLKRVVQVLENVPEKSSQVSNAISTIRSTLSFMHHLSQEDSAFIQAMTNGDWVLLDGIESAPKELFEKISSLCAEDPFLDLFEKGPSFRYSRTAGGKLKIHDNFHLFITYNSKEIEPSRRLNPN